MSTSSKLKFLVKREDTGKVDRIEIEEDKQIFDLLESSRLALKFKEDAMLHVYRDGDEKVISEAFYLREMADPKDVLIIKDKRMEEKEKCKQQRAAKDKGNMANATKMKESITEKLNKRDNLNDSHDDFCKHVTNQAPSSYMAEHNLLHNLKQQTRSGDTFKGASRDVSEDEEIRILSRKINNEGLEGFVYEIIPKSYTDHNESSYYECSFSSEEERTTTQSKVNSTTNWSSWQAEAGFSGWGVSVSTSAGQNTSASEHERRMTQSTEKTRVAVVTKTSYHQMKKFKVKVKLDEKAIEDAKEILDAPMSKKQQAINEFNNKYCSFVYSGQFSAGGWFRTVATARSTEAMEFRALVKEATDKTETHWSAGASGYGVSAAGGQNMGTSDQRNCKKSQQNINCSVQVLIRNESAPGNTSSGDELEEKIKYAKYWTVFPVIGAKKSHFTPVYEIIKHQAEVIGDKELERVSHIMRLNMKGEWGVPKKGTSTLMAKSQGTPYVVLLGDVGTGKSTIVEKLTGEKGRSSDANESVTRTSEVFWTPDGSLLVCDTPGSNSLEDTLQHNIWIASALNFMPVSRIFIVIKAEARIDSVVGNVCKYTNCFLDLPMEVVRVLVTHMDTVGWTENDFMPKIEKKLGIDQVVFSWINTKRETLVHDILKTCTDEPHNLTVNGENFFQLFSIHSNHWKILKTTDAEVKKFRAKKKAFDEARKNFSGKDEVDLVFEFQAYMTDEIAVAQYRMSNANKFTFDGDGAANEAGHVANMVNQLRAVLYQIRVECVGYQSEHGVSELRKCPYCPMVWTKVEGCVDKTQCGRRPSFFNDIRGFAFAVLATFSFEWNADTNRLSITKSGNKSVKSGKSTETGAGCGRDIVWNEMKTVDFPPEFRESAKVHTSDVKMLPSAASGFRKELDNKLNDAQKGIKLADRPT